MEIAKEGINFNTQRKRQAKRREVGFFENYKLFIIAIILTLTFSVINIIPISYMIIV